MNVVIGIDMGATHIRICVMSLEGNILTCEKKKTGEVISVGLVEGISQLCETVSYDYLVSKIIIGLPASISLDRRTVLSIPNLSIKLSEIDKLKDKLENKFNTKVYLERDVNLQMIYDINHYNLQDKLVLGIYLGTGIGFSIWNKGDIFVGAHGVAGELGHIPYGKENKQCGCGNYSCLETMYSGSALYHWYKEHNFKFPFEEIFKQEECHNFVKEYLKNIAKAICTAINLFDPHVIILGGGVIDMESFPFQELIESIKEYTRNPLPYEDLEILKATSSSFNGAIGAALYARGGIK